MSTHFSLGGLITRQHSVSLFLSLFGERTAVPHICLDDIRPLALCRTVSNTLYSDQF